VQKNVLERVILALLVPLVLFTLARVLEAERWRGMIEERVAAVTRGVDRIERKLDQP